MGSDYIRQWFLNVVEFALQGAFLVVTMGGGGGKESVATGIWWIEVKDAANILQCKGQSPQQTLIY